MSLLQQLLALHRADVQVRSLRSRLSQADRYLATQQKQLDDVLAQRGDVETQRRQLQAQVANMEMEGKAIGERIEALRGVTLGTTAVEDAIARGMAFMPKSSGGPRAQAPVNTVGDERRGGRGGRGGPRGGGGGRRFEGGGGGEAPAAAPAAPTTEAPAADAPSAG
jgi:hypothetical protein